MSGAGDARRASLQVTELRKSYATAGGPVDVLRGVSFELKGGEALAITGPSGSGKSTLLHVLGTLDRPSSGRLAIGGEDPFELDDTALARFRNRAVGFIFQDHHLLPQYTLAENVLLPALAFPGDQAAARERARELIERVGLSHRGTHRPSELSGGERQRAAVARALLNRPALLLCDEPTGNLDHATAATVADLLFELHREEANVLIVVTHSRDLAARFERRSEVRAGLLAPV